MARIRCLHLADLHLGWTPRAIGGREEERRQERDGLIKKAVDLALAYDSGIQMVIIAGDLFETHRPESGLVDTVLQELNRLEKAGIPIITVPGNHDEVTYYNSVYRQRRAEWPGILVTNPMPDLVATIELGDTSCHIYSMAYTGGLTQATEPLREFLHAQEDGIHLGVFHGSLDWDAGERSLPLSSQALAEVGYDYIALGHIHQYREKAVGDVLMLYPGAVEGKTFADPGEGFFTVVDIGNGLPVINKIPAQVRAYRQIKIDVTGMDSELELEEEITKKADPEAMVEIRLMGVFSYLPNLTNLVGRVKNQFYHVEIKDDTEFFNLETLKLGASEPTIQGCFLRRMLSRLETAEDEKKRKTIYLALAKGISAFAKGEK